MASSGGSVFSATLQEITNTKLEELSKRRTEFETAKAKILSRLGNESTPLERLKILSRGVKECYSMKTTKTGVIHSGDSSHADVQLELKHLDSFMDQAEFDPSVSPSMLKTWEDSLLNRLDIQSSKFRYASLYAQLVTEWLSTENAAPSGASAAPQEDVSMTEDFEDLGDSMKKESRGKWEKLVFEPANVDESALKSYLSQLFDLRVSAETSEQTPITKALNRLREAVTDHENNMAAANQFDTTSLEWVINGLLASDLLTEEKREVLRDIQRNPVILAEVADILNLRMSAFGTWSWGESVALEQRRKITGVYNILMHEDVLQAIFLHYVGVKWSVFLKSAFRDFQKMNSGWKLAAREVPQLDLERRRYYLGLYDTMPRVRNSRNRLFLRHYFMEGLMDRETQQSLVAEGEEEAEYTPPQTVQAVQQQQHRQQHRQQQQLQMQMMQQRSQQTRHQFGAGPMTDRHVPMGLPPLPPAPVQRPTMSLQRRKNPAVVVVGDSDSDCGYDDDYNIVPNNRHPMEDKQRLIRLLSTEIAINTKLHGEMTAFHAAFESWNSLLPHETILTVMRLFGVSDTWMDFFTKFLKAPLKFVEDGADKPPRTRRRGTPASHILSDVFGESILFCLDFAVNRSTNGKYLHRMRDDFFFWSPDHEVAKTAWKAVETFTNATRTYIHFPKSGSVRISRDPDIELEIDESLPKGDIRWGFLRLSTLTGKFEIDQGIVDKHVIDLRRQLVDKRRSVISLIQTWNTFAATFFTSNFGKAANCFGRAHVDEMLATHRRIQAELFASPSSLASLLAGDAQPTERITNVVDYIKHLLRTRFDVAEEIPDAYLFFPVELGGLDLRSPFVSILPVRENILSDPGRELDKFLEAERDEYNTLKQDYERRYAAEGLPGAHGFKPADPAAFMSLDEFARYREDLGYGFANNLDAVFKRLLQVPGESSGGGIREPSARLKNAIQALGNDSGGGNAANRALKGILSNYDAMQPYWRWIAQLYGPDALDRFGGLRIVEPGLLPMGMVSIFRDKRVTWQG